MCVYVYLCVCVCVYIYIYDATDGKPTLHYHES